AMKKPEGLVHLLQRLLENGFEVAPALQRFCDLIKNPQLIDNPANGLGKTFQIRLAGAGGKVIASLLSAILTSVGSGFREKTIWRAGFFLFQEPQLVKQNSHQRRGCAEEISCSLRVLCGRARGRVQTANVKKGDPVCNESTLHSIQYAFF
ncbi:MAG: hypothetical protein SNJ52_03350, partial [Verrucomicrobiia bacterium]